MTPCVIHEWSRERCSRCGLSVDEWLACEKEASRARLAKRAFDRIAAELRQPPPPYVTVAECGHCFEDVGERA